MKYELLVDYTTGDSYGSEEIVGEDMGVVFENKELAKAALIAVKEHYVACRAYEDAPYNTNVRSKTNPPLATKESIEAEVHKKPWCGDREDLYFGGWRFSINLVLDDHGRKQRVHVPYTGYFETLHKAYVRATEGDGLTITFGG